MPLWNANVHAVVARFRPPNKTEIAAGGEPIVDFDSEDTCRINVRNSLATAVFTRKRRV